MLSLLALFLLIGSWANIAEAQESAPIPADADHSTSIDYHRPVKDQVRYLFRHWPRDFEIAVLESLGHPRVTAIQQSDGFLGTELCDSGKTLDTQSRKPRN